MSQFTDSRMKAISSVITPLQTNMINEALEGGVFAIDDNGNNWKKTYSEARQLQAMGLTVKAYEGIYNVWHLTDFGNKWIDFWLKDLPLLPHLVKGINSCLKDNEFKSQGQTPSRSTAKHLSILGLFTETRENKLNRGSPKGIRFFTLTPLGQRLVELQPDLFNQASILQWEPCDRGLVATFGGYDLTIHRDRGISADWLVSVSMKNDSIDLFWGVRFTNLEKAKAEALRTLFNWHLSENKTILLAMENQNERVANGESK